MPKSTRLWSKRELQAARKNLDWAGKHVIAVYETYNEGYPEIGQKCELIIEAMVMLDDLIEKLEKSY